MAESTQFKTLLFGLVKQAKLDISARFAAAGISITPFQYGVLAIIKHKSQTLAEIAKKLGIKSPSALPYIDGLVEHGFVAKHINKTDRRKIQLKITPKGEKLFAHIAKGHPTDILNRAFHKMPKQKQKQLVSLLKELTDNFSK